MRFIPILMLSATAALAANDCGALAKLALPATTMTRAEVVAAGTFQPPAGRAFQNMPAFCRVAGTIKPSDDSNIQFEVWLPASGWNGRFQGIGNGGFAGSIDYTGLAGAVAHGYVTAATDTGHAGGPADATWALHHPEKIVDFGYRAVHLMTVNAKAILHAYYGSDASHSYFSSCSNGGRQALMEAQRYPEDYDGVIAGAPANYWTHLLSNAVWDLQAMEGDGYIPPKKLPAIQAAAQAACDSLDGVKDGLIEDPSRCHFDPSTIECKGAEAETCLTAAQVTALKKLYTGGTLAVGRKLFPGYAPGGEATPGGWVLWITGPSPDHSLMYAFGTQFYRNMLFDNPEWDYHTFDTDRDTKAADAKFAAVLNATSPDLSRFAARGGRLILYHGWDDAAIAPGNTIDYYKSVRERMGARKTASFVRLFMVPGMQHCFGGAGPSSFGQFTVGGGDAGHDLDAAIERWVEKDVAPEQVIAAKRKSDFDPKSEVLRTRPLCAWPMTAHYKGSGSIDDAASFTCSTSASQ